MVTIIGLIFFFLAMAFLVGALAALLVEDEASPPTANSTYFVPHRHESWEIRVAPVLPKEMQILQEVTEPTESPIRLSSVR